VADRGADARKTNDGERFNRARHRPNEDDRFPIVIVNVTSFSKLGHVLVIDRTVSEL
jgi:hypothetical protein